jgi:hypothetical protein
MKTLCIIVVAIATSFPVYSQDFKVASLVSSTPQWSYTPVINFPENSFQLAPGKKKIKLGKVYWFWFGMPDWWDDVDPI